MKNYHNIETRKFSPRHDYYVAYGAGHVWHVYRNGRAGWIAASNYVPFVIKGRILDDISTKLAKLVEC